MKSVKASDVTGSLSDYARKGLREPLVVTRQGKPVIAVMPLTKYDDWESAFTDGSLGCPRSPTRS